MRNLILFACFFNFFINPVFAEFQTSEILEKIKNGRAAIYSSLDLTSEQTHEINELDRIFYEKLYPELQEMSMLSQKLERIASSSDCTIKKVKSVRKEFKVVERNLNLLKKDYEKIVAHAEKELPNEACGLIGGTINGDSKKIKKVYLLTNIDHSNEHFSLDPKEQLAAIKDMRQNGLVPLGNWHSHPESPSRPSDEDKRLAYDSKASYMILSLMDRQNPVLNSFKITGDTAEKEELVIE